MQILCKYNKKSDNPEGKLGLGNSATHSCDQFFMQPTSQQSSTPKTAIII